MGKGLVNFLQRIDLAIMHEFLYSKAFGSLLFGKMPFVDFTN